MEFLHTLFSRISDICGFLVFIFGIYGCFYYYRKCIEESMTMAITYASSYLLIGIIAGLLSFATKTDNNDNVDDGKLVKDSICLNINKTK